MNIDFNSIINSKSKYFILIVILLSLNIVTFFYVLSHLQSNSASQAQQGTIPIQIFPSPTPDTVSYNHVQTKKVLNLLVNRQPLSTADNQAKQQLISNANGDQIYSSADFIVEYIKIIDKFQVQITTVDISRAEEEAVNWFISQGLSHNGVCSLPVNFYVGGNVIQILKSNNQFILVNPLPAGC